MSGLSRFSAPVWRIWGLTALVAWAVFTLTRVGLFAHALQFSGQSASALAGAFWRGALRDLLVAVWAASPFLILGLLPAGWRKLKTALLAVYVFTLLFVAVSEGIFWDEFSVRFNFIALDYLVFTTEVIGNIRESYPVGKIISVLLVLTLAVVWALRRPWQQVLAAAGRRRDVLFALALAGLVWGAGYALKPPEFSSNAFANELADNGWRSFLWAARQNRLDYLQFYATRPEAAVLADLRRLAGKPAVSAELPEVLPVGTPRQRPNVVVVMMESMSAEYMAKFGNAQGLTPQLDRLADEGILFSRLYATGTRTVRGLEALSAALPPLPGKSVVRWEGVRDLYTLGSVLARRGWSPHFLYGGYGMFDNMNGFFSAQGYQVTDRTGFAPGLVTFENIWGVADEHLFDQALMTADQEASAGRPFFMHLMTASNHVPFTYPDGRIDIPSPGGRPGGIKYADYALGRFIEQARHKPWFDNTLFLMVADHCARSAGKTKIPVYRYHIPAVLYAPKRIAPRVVDQLASQIDLAPTVLAMLGLQSDDRFVGRDILHTPPAEGRALLSTYQNLGYLKGDTLTVLQPKRKVEAFKVSADGQEATAIPVDQALADEAIAYFQGAALLMSRHGQVGRTGEVHAETGAAGQR